MQKKYFSATVKNKLVYCPLNSLVPEDIKQDYSQHLKKDVISRTQYYFEVSNKLGISNWSNYIAEFENKIKPFMLNHGLINYAKDLDINLLNTYYPFNFSYRNISDRFFLSNKNLPNEIFTGYKNTYLEENISTLLAHNTFLFDRDYDLEFSREFAIHLIGDLCFKHNDKDNLFLQIYNEGDGLLIHTPLHKKILKKMKQSLLNQKKGWLEIIPYNKNLIFLKTDNGTYDFVFKGIRDSEFISPFKDYLKEEDIPSDINEDYDFQFWLYHGKKYPKDSINFLWKEKDEHEAEIEFYKNKTSKNYPGMMNILKNYYKKQEIYSYNNNQSKHIHKNYELIEVEGKMLCISQLISISDFFEFYNDNYKNRRSKYLEEIYSVNFEKPVYPVCVTWYDAIAYCKYLQTKYKKPFRLLTANEFEYISPKIENMSKFEEELNYSYNYEEFNYPAPIVDKYENLLLKFSKPLEFVENKNLKFPLNSRFKEWSKEFVNNTVSICSAYEDDYYKNLNLNRFSTNSNMKYKYLKVGFRVCYEVSKDIL